MNYEILTAKHNDFYVQLFAYRDELIEVINEIGNIIQEHYDFPKDVNGAGTFRIVPPDKINIEDFKNSLFTDVQKIIIRDRGWIETAFVFNIGLEYFRIKLKVKKENDQILLFFHFRNDPVSVEVGGDLKAAVLPEIEHFFLEMTDRRFDSWYNGVEGVPDNFS